MIGDMSLNQEREYWDEKIGEAMRRVQHSKELSEEFAKLYLRISSVEPVSPTAGIAQRSVLDFCDAQRHQCIYTADERQIEVERLKGQRP